MRKKQKAYGLTLLCAFAAIFSFGFLAPDAAPLSAQKTQVVILEDNNADFKTDLLRSADTQQESTKQHNDIEISHVEVFHSESVSVRTAQIADLENAERPTSFLYLAHSNFRI